MRRIQIVMSEDLDDALERRARKERTSKSELIRRFVRHELRPLPPLEEDPLWRLVGSCALGPEPLEPVDDVDRTVYLDEVEAELRGGGPLPAGGRTRPRQKAP
ncbi:MAG: CopG family transcriptional regulator [Chloroflexota bacterium]|nr:ribbon-helix-helix protein, CopG family [Chloroflexota bacterium]MDE3102067.1 CopG family transcriptional regulator [Chloroflexota bacterium]